MRRIGTALLTVLTVLLPLALITQAGPAQAEVSFNQKMLELVNQQRALAGIGPLLWSPSLGAAAEDAPYSGCGFTVQGRAKDMGQRNYFSHNILGCLTQSVFNLLGGLGILSSASGENIAWMNGTTDYSVAAQRLTNDLMNSPGHRANILNPDYTHVGIGSWRTGAGQTWSGAGTPLTNVWIAAQIFGRMSTTSAPAVAMGPTSLAFGDRAVTTAGPAQTVTVTNQGNAPLIVSIASIGGANSTDFRITANGCGTVAAGANCGISVVFAPGSTGTKSATLSVTSDAVGSPHSVSLTGTGTGSVPVVPAAPVNVQAKGGDGQLKVTWSHAPSGAASDEYAVALWNANGFTGQEKRVCATCLAAGFTGLTNGKAYYVTVYGHASGGWSNPGYSGWATVASVPTAPTRVRVTPGNGEMSTTWVAPTTSGAAIDGYGMFVYNAAGYTGKAAWVCATCTTASVGGLTNGSSYYAVVYAHNALGWGSPAVTPSVTVGTPGAPANLVASPGVGRVNLSWAAAPNSGSPVSLYAAYAFDPLGKVGGWTMVCGTCTTASIAGLTSGRAYNVVVYAYNSVGWGAASETRAVTAG